MERFEHQLRKFIVENFLFGDETMPFSNEESLLDRGLIDSTGVLELVAFLQQNFGITIADDEIVPDNLDSILGISDFVEQKLQARA